MSGDDTIPFTPNPQVFECIVIPKLVDQLSWLKRHPPKPVNSEEFFQVTENQGKVIASRMASNPVYNEHFPDIQVGEVLSAWVNDRKQLLAKFQINSHQTPAACDTAAMMHLRMLPSVSLGHIRPDKPFELTVCNVPGRPNAGITSGFIEIPGIITNSPLRMRLDKIVNRSKEVRASITSDRELYLKHVLPLDGDIVRATKNNSDNLVSREEYNHRLTQLGMDSKRESMNHSADEMLPEHVLASGGELQAPGVQSTGEVANIHSDGNGNGNGNPSTNPPFQLPPVIRQAMRSGPVLTQIHGNDDGKTRQVSVMSGSGVTTTTTPQGTIHRQHGHQSDTMARLVSLTAGQSGVPSTTSSAPFTPMHQLSSPSASPASSSSSSQSGGPAPRHSGATEGPPVERAAQDILIAAALRDVTSTDETRREESFATQQFLLDYEELKNNHQKLQAEATRLRSLQAINNNAANGHLDPRKAQLYQSYHQSGTIDQAARHVAQHLSSPNNASHSSGGHSSAKNTEQNDIHYRPEQAATYQRFMRLTRSMPKNIPGPVSPSQLPPAQRSVRGSLNSRHETVGSTSYPIPEPEEEDPGELSGPDESYNSSRGMTSRLSLSSSSSSSVRAARSHYRGGDYYDDRDDNGGGGGGNDDDVDNDYYDGRDDDGGDGDDSYDTKSSDMSSARGVMVRSKPMAPMDASGAVRASVSVPGLENVYLTTCERLSHNGRWWIGRLETCPPGIPSISLDTAVIASATRAYMITEQIRDSMGGGGIIRMPSDNPQEMKNLGFFDPAPGANPYTLGPDDAKVNASIQASHIGVARSYSLDSTNVLGSRPFAQSTPIAVPPASSFLSFIHPLALKALGCGDDPSKIDLNSDAGACISDGIKREKWRFFSDFGTGRGGWSKLEGYK